MLKVVVLGTGRMAERHARIIGRLRRAQIFVASRDPGRAGAFARRLGLAGHFASYAEGLESDCGLVVVAVPPRGHFDLTLRSLELGKDVLVEKPLCCSLDEITRLAPLWQSGRNVAMVAENQLFSPLHCKIKRAIQEGALGAPLVLELTRVGRNSPGGWRHDELEMPLGALHEGGIHWIARLLDLASLSGDHQDVVGVTAFVPKVSLTGTPGEDTMLIIGRHRSGLVSRLLHSWGIPRRAWWLELSRFIFERGAIHFDIRGLMALVHRGTRRRILWPALRDRGGTVAMWRHFLECVDARRSPQVTLEQNFREFSYLEAAYRSSVSGREIEPVKTPHELVAGRQNRTDVP